MHLTVHVYRRVPPFQWDRINDRPQPVAFIRRPEERGLSVYRSDLCTPRRVFELMLEGQRAKSRAGDASVQARASRWFERNGDTLELFYERGWRIVRLPIAAFADRGFGIEHPDEDGHLDIVGPLQLFQTQALPLTAEAKTLSLAECLS